jgi:hypothetical protein
MGDPIMPFQSKSQMKYLFAKHPDVAEEFASGMSPDSIKHLPDRLSDLGEKPKSVRYASDERVKTNVEDASMDIDKAVRGGVLQRLIEDLQELDFDSKVKPKMVKLEMHSGEPSGGEEIPEETEGEVESTESEEVCPECGGEGCPECEGKSGKMDPRLAEIVAKKKSE